MLVHHERLPLLIRILSSLVAAWLLLGGLVSPALAKQAADPISVTTQSQSVHFPDYIDFQLSAVDSLAPIISAAIHLSVPMFDANDTETVSVTKSKNVTIHWRMSISGENYVLPGMSITYYWELTDSIGNVHLSKYINFNVYDTRFPWQSTTQGYIHIHWYNTLPGFSQALLSRAKSDQEHLAQVTGLSYHHAFDLWIYSSQSAFRSALPPDTFEWVGGVAFPPLNEAFFTVTSPTDETLIRDMPHEMTHLLLHQTVPDRVDIPRWFDEGLAVYCQLFQEPELTDRLNEALRTHSLLPLSQISERFPSSSDAAELAYAESWNLVTYMYQTFGKTNLEHLFQLLSSGKLTFDEALQASISEDEAHLENQWHLALHQPPTLSPAEMQTPAVPPASTTQLRLPTPATSDSHDTLLLLLGTALMLTALVGTMLLLTSARHQRLQAMEAVQAAEQILAISRRDWQAPPPSDSSPSSGPFGRWLGRPTPGTGASGGSPYFNIDQPFGLPGTGEGPQTRSSQGSEPDDD